MNQATEADHKENYEEAFKLYERSLEYFMMAMKCNFRMFYVSLALTLTPFVYRWKEPEY